MKLKNCPFCGKDTANLVHDNDDWNIYCLNCNARTDEYVTEKYAITAWNMRKKAKSHRKQP